MASGQLLCSMLFDTGLTSIAMDASDNHVFVGGITGKIYHINLSENVSSAYLSNFLWVSICFIYGHLNLSVRSCYNLNQPLISARIRYRSLD